MLTNFWTGKAQLHKTSVFLGRSFSYWLQKFQLFNSSIIMNGKFKVRKYHYRFPFSTYRNTFRRNSVRSMLPLETFFLELLPLRVFALLVLFILACDGLLDLLSSNLLPGAINSYKS